MSSIEVREISRAFYARFLEGALHSAFHRLEWLALVERIYPITVFLLGYFRNDVLIAVTPLLRRRLGPFVLCGAPLRKCPIPPATPFCAPPEMAEMTLPALESWIRSQGLGYTQATVPSRGHASRFLGDAAEVLDNLELCISRPLPELWQLLPKKNRYTVRKAIKDGIRLHWACSDSFIGIQAKLLHDTYARQGPGVRSNYPLDLYRELFAERRETGLRVLYATHAGRVVAAAWLLADVRRCYYWDAVTAEEGRRLSANQALVWSLIRWAHRRGFDTLDFVGTATGGRGGSRPGIGHFKRSMGAEPVEYYIVYWYSRAYRCALRVYRLWTHLKRYARILLKARLYGRKH